MAKLDTAFRILLAEDDPAFVGRAQRALDELAQVRVAPTGTSALKTTVLWKPDIIVFDLLMEDLDGFTFVEELSSLRIDRLPFILCTIDGRGADTWIRPVPDWRFGTLLRSSSIHQIRSAVLEAARLQDSTVARSLTV